MNIVHNKVNREKIQFKKVCVWVVARLHQRLKSTFIEIFSSPRVPFAGILHSKIFQKTLIGGEWYIVLPKWAFFRVLAHCAHVEFDPKPRASYTSYCFFSSWPRCTLFLCSAIRLRRRLPSNGNHL